MVLGAAEGMRHLHAHAVLHRDLKSGALSWASGFRVFWCIGFLVLGFLRP